MKLKSILCLMLAIATIFVCAACSSKDSEKGGDAKGGASAASTANKTEAVTENAMTTESGVMTTESGSGDMSFSVGSVIKFGKYEQDNDMGNGKEDIEWIVLEVNGDEALIISKYGLDCKKYNVTWRGVTWETCTLRSWLNGEFVSGAFSSSETSRIKTATLKNDDNPSYGTKGGNDTNDKVFLLSIDEANKYFNDDEARQCSATAYSKAQGTYTDSSNGNCAWWLRSPGISSGSAACVNSDGFVGSSGYSVHQDDFSVRPALRIDLKS